MLLLIVPTRNVPCFAIATRSTVYLAAACHPLAIALCNMLLVT